MTSDVTRAKLARARALLAAGDVAGARREAEASLASEPSSSAELLLAACAGRAGDRAAERLHVERALAIDPDDALAHYAAAELQERAGQADAAIASLQRAIALQPGLAPAHQLLGILHGERDDNEAAARAFARVVALDAKNAVGYHNLGSALRGLGRAAEASAAFERAVVLRPDYDLAIANLAMLWRDAGETKRAEALLRAALARPGGKAPLRALVVLLAGLLRERGALDEAEKLYERAIAMAPAASAGEWFQIGLLHAEWDEPERAREAFHHSHVANARDLRPAIASRLVLPQVYEDSAAIERTRARFAEGLADLHASADRLVADLAGDELLDGLRWSNFFLAYQGGDDRALQASYAAFVARAIDIRAAKWREPLPTTSTSGRRIRVGFASAFFRDGTAGRYFRSWITDLDRERFDVRVYHLYPGIDDIAAEIRARADRFVDLGGSRARPSIVAPIVRDDRLDVLVYPELGMDHASFALAALRLAPRQIAGWGHPVTTGHTTIDAFATCETMEPADADAHYVEPLVRLPGIGTRYRMPPLPARATRVQLGLPEDRVLLLCPQSLFKVHPDNDTLFAEILAANPRVVLVMFDGRHRRVTERFVARIARAFDDSGVDARERLVLLPARPHDDYLRVNLACDAMLDTLHWSGGNTTLDALACALPIVTLPGRFMRSRQSAAMLRIVGAPQLTACDRHDYVRIASRLVQDREWRMDIASQIRVGQAILFDSPEPGRAFADLLVRLVAS